MAIPINNYFKINIQNALIKYIVLMDKIFKIFI